MFKGTCGQPVSFISKEANIFIVVSFFLAWLVLPCEAPCDSP